MVCMQDEHELEGTHRHRVGHVGLGPNREHHLQEVLHEPEAFDRVHERLADGILVRVGRDGRHLRDDADRVLFFLIQATDTTDRRRSELERSQLLETNPQVADPPDIKVVPREEYIDSL